jgi:hypothetical protein
MTVDPRPGKPATTSILVNLPRLMTEYCFLQVPGEDLLAAA